jgi:hypothetical protein
MRLGSTGGRNANLGGGAQQRYEISVLQMLRLHQFSARSALRTFLASASYGGIWRLLWRAQRFGGNAQVILGLIGHCAWTTKASSTEVVALENLRRHSLYSAAGISKTYCGGCRARSLINSREEVLAWLSDISGRLVLGSLQGAYTA